VPPRARAAKPFGAVTTTKHRTQQETWRAFFAHPAYVQFATQILDAERTAREVAALARELDLRPGSRVLDLGCGHGRIALPLARMGCAVTALDGSPALLDQAREAARAERLPIEFVAADMRDLDRAECFDAVISVGTALGYVEDEADDAAALQAAARALASGGRLVVDTENREPKLRQAQRVWFDSGGVVVRCLRTYDHLSGRWAEEIRWGDGEHERATYSVRLYSVAELRALFERCALRVDGLWGELGGGAYHADAPRTVILGVRA